MSQVALQFIFESLCYFARIDETNARQMALTYIDRGYLTDAQIMEISEILGSTIEPSADPVLAPASNDDPGTND